MVARGTILLTLIALMASLASCNINPVPEPPSQQPIDPPNTEQVILAPDPMMANDEVDVSGQPGAAEPGSQLWVTNLDGTAPPAVTDVLPDGSFTMVVTGFAGDELRLQLRDDERRSNPIDVLIPNEQGPAVLSVRPLAACLTFEPPLELFLPAPDGTQAPSASISIENHCDADVVIDEQRLRTSSTSFVVEPAQPVIPMGGFGEIVVRGYGAPGDEEVLLVQIASPQADRRPVTLVSGGGAPGVQPACEQVGGACRSDPMDATFPANCEQLGEQTLQATCVAFNKACCATAL